MIRVANYFDNQSHFLTKNVKDFLVPASQHEDDLLLFLDVSDCWFKLKISLMVQRNCDEHIFTFYTLNRLIDCKNMGIQISLFYGTLLPPEILSHTCVWYYMHSMAFHPETPSVHRYTKPRKSSAKK